MAESHSKTTMAKQVKMAKNSIKAMCILMLTVAMTLLSCNRKTVYDQYGHTPVTGWEKNDTLSFHVRPMEQEGEYVEQLGLRINGAYPFMSLCLVVEQRVHPSGFTFRDTVNCRLTDNMGNIQGHGISYYQYQVPITSIHLAQGDSIDVFIRHNMKREILPGISDIGLKITRR